MKTQRIIGHAFALVLLSVSSFSQIIPGPTTTKDPQRGPQPVPPSGPTISTSTSGTDKADTRPQRPTPPQTTNTGALATQPVAAKKEPVVIPDRKLTSEGRMALIRGLTAELGFARKPFPMGQTGLKLDAATGAVTPDDQQLNGIMAAYGPSVRVGDRARITAMKIKDKSILFDINGGAVKKKKWYEHIEVSGGGGSVSPGQPTDNTNARGSLVELKFDKFVPDLTTEQVKQLLDPVLNFNAKSATEAYLETIPPVAKKAISDHKALVGMNREMVIYAKGRPPQKHREKDGDAEYEEWIYGVPPQDVEFIRFMGDEVIRIENMKVDGTKQVRTDREVVLQKEQPEVAQQQSGQPGADGAQTQGQQGTKSADSDDGPKGKPSLKRPGEEVDTPPMKAPPKNSPLPGPKPKDTPAPPPPGA